MSDIYKLVRQEFLTSKQTKDELKKVRSKKAEFSKSLQDAFVELAKEGDAGCILQPFAFVSDKAVIKKSDANEIERAEGFATVQIPGDLVDAVVEVLRDEWRFSVEVYAAARNIWKVRWDVELPKEEPAQPSPEGSEPKDKDKVNPK